MQEYEFAEGDDFPEIEYPPDWEGVSWEAEYLPPDAYSEEESSPPYASEIGGFLFPALLPPALVLFFGGLLAFFVYAFFPAAAPVQREAALVLPAEAPLSSEGGAPANEKETLAPLFTPEVQYWKKDIWRWARRWDLDPNLVATVMQIESCGNPQATSRAGAMGLFQVMPFHFKSGEDPYDPDTNALRGLGYLRRSLDAFGQEARLALAGYNGGIGGASRPESLWAAETVRYVYWGAGIYAEARAGKKQSARLQEWLNAGGASLCAQARRVLGVR